MNEDDANRAWLIGCITGALMLHEEFTDVQLEADEHGDYTSRILIKRQSGTWALSAEKLPDD